MNVIMPVPAWFLANWPTGAMPAGDCLKTQVSKLVSYTAARALSKLAKLASCMAVCMHQPVGHAPANFTDKLKLAPAPGCVLV